MRALLARRLAPLSLSALMAVSGCSQQGAGQPATALLGGMLADSPWPSDLFLADGRLKMTRIPLSGPKQSLDVLADALGELDGAPLSSSVFFPTVGSALSDGPLEGRATLVDLTEADPAYGSQIALQLYCRASTRQIVAMLPGGVGLHEGHRYGCMLESRHVKPSPAMLDALSGRGPYAKLYAPLVAYLAESGTRIDNVGAATVFTAGHPTRRLRDARAALETTPLPKATVIAVAAGSRLHDLLGSPKTTRSGLGDPAGVVHESMGFIVRGTFDAPYYLSDSLSKLGRIHWDAQGRPIPRATSQVPFLLALPARTATGYETTPVIIFQHGLNAGMTQVLAVANDFARAGYATIGIDALWHGNRLPSYTDAKHNITETPGADGLADGDPFGATLLFFDIAGVPAEGIEPFDPRIIRDNFHQAVLDIAQLVRLIRQGDLSAIRAAHPALAKLSFDSKGLIYAGESFGSILGAQVLAIEQGLGAGVLAVGGAGLVTKIFAQSPVFATVISLILEGAFDAGIKVGRPAELPPESQLSLNLLGAAIEPSDPAAFAPLIARQSPGQPKSLLLLHADSDETMPNQAGDQLAALCGATVATIPAHTRPLHFIDLPSAALPIAANQRGATVVVASFDPATHIMYTRFGDERKLRPGFPPAVLRDRPEPVDNPIELLHTLTVEFARTVRTGVATVRLPP